MEVKISIIIPFYNVEKYLRECLDSILNQTFQDFEIICVDDGSTDKSLEILQEYKRKDDRFVILQQRHSGAGAARNYGIKSAKGKYVQFLDSDDWFEPEMLEELYSRAEKFNTDIVVCSSRKFDEEGNLLESGKQNASFDTDITPQEQPFSGLDFKENIFCINNTAPWNKLYLKQFLLDNNIKFQNLTSCNDVAFSLESLACAKRIVAFNKEYINRRYGRSGSITEKRANSADNIVRAYLEVKRFLKARELYDIYEKTLINVIKKGINGEISLCNDEQYKKFVTGLKQLMSEDWQIFASILKKDYITPEYLNQFIGDKKVLLWGTSLFIQEVLKNEKSPNPNILGFIDKNCTKWGKMCGKYEIYPPKAINELKPDGVLMTVLSEHETVYESLKKEFEEKYSRVELLPNIFNEEVKFDNGN